MADKLTCAVQNSTWVLQEQEEWHKICALTDRYHFPKPRPCQFSISLFPAIPRQIPKHPTALISKNMTRNKACQTHRAYNARWPEVHMDPTEYFITPQKCIRNVTLTELTIIQTNDKSTQTVQNTNHHWVTSVLHPDAKHVSNNNFSLQTQSARSGKPETTPKSRLDGGRVATSNVGFSWEETMKMWVLFNSHCCATSFF